MSLTTQGNREFAETGLSPAPSDQSRDRLPFTSRSGVKGKGAVPFRCQRPFQSRRNRSLTVAALFATLQLPCLTSLANGTPPTGPTSFQAGSPSMTDSMAMAVVAAGLLCYLWRRRIGEKAGASLFAGLTTAGAAILIVGQDVADLALIPRASQTAAALSALWGLLAWLRSGGTNRDSARPPPAECQAFFIWSLFCGTVTVALVVQALVRATGLRLLELDAAFQRLSSEGLMDLLAVILAVLFWRATVSRPRQPVILLLLAVLAVWWTSLMIPTATASAVSVGPPDLGGATFWHDIWPAWWSWTFHLQIGLAVVLVAASLMQERRYRRRRNRAWPDRLDDLLEPYPRWPAYVQAESVVAAAVLILGVYQIVSPQRNVWLLDFANFAVSLSAGLTCLFMTYRRWSGNTAGLGVALLTLSLVALACLVSSFFVPQDVRADYARRIPVLDNAVLFALAVAIVYWSWLTRFWQQQLHGGRPWTTAGRMIPFADRAAFLLAGLAALVAFRMALWPRQIQVNVEDNSIGRMAAGLLAIFLLSLISTWKARRTDSWTQATLAIAFLIAAVVFVFVRVPPAQRQTWGWLIQYEAVVLSALCLPLIVAAEALHRTKWRSFSTPLWLLALLIVPMRTLILLLPSNRLPAEWVRPMALAILGALYSFAGSRENRRAILVLGAVLLVAAVTTFYRAYGKSIM